MFTNVAPAQFVQLNGTLARMLSERFTLLDEV
jgi:hypothetical protein